MEECGLVTVGIFWELSDGDVLEFSKKCMLNEADSCGFINYRYSYYEMWVEASGGRGDCYRYPRGRVIFDANAGEHIVYADRCVSAAGIAEIYHRL